MRNFLAKRIGIILSLVVILALALVLLSGCGGGTTNTDTKPVANRTASSETTLHTLVPCGQSNPYFAVEELFRKANPNISIVPTTENITAITYKVLDGKETPDVFVSMGDLELNLLETKGRVEKGTRVKIAPNSLALITSKKNPLKLKELKDLAKPEVKSIALANPEVTASGFHAREALQKLGIWETIKNKTRTPDQPEAVAEEVARGDVDAGIAYWPCMFENPAPGAEPTPKRKLTIVEAIPQKLYTPFFCEAAVIKGSKNQEAAKKFIAFFQTPEAKAIYTKWRFISQEDAAASHK
jgi:molybdate transport system substrate-binding protein